MLALFSKKHAPRQSASAARHRHRSRIFLRLSDDLVLGSLGFVDGLHCHWDCGMLTKVPNAVKKTEG
jgi:hypothetical protein